MLIPTSSTEAFWVSLLLLLSTLYRNLGSYQADNGGSSGREVVPRGGVGIWKKEGSLGPYPIPSGANAKLCCAAVTINPLLIRVPEEGPL